MLTVLTRYNILPCRCVRWLTEEFFIFFGDDKFKTIVIFIFHLCVRQVLDFQTIRRFDLLISCKAVIGFHDFVVAWRLVVIISQSPEWVPISIFRRCIQIHRLIVVVSLRVQPLKVLKMLIQVLLNLERVIELARVPSWEVFLRIPARTILLLTFIVSLKSFTIAVEIVSIIVLNITIGSATALVPFSHRILWWEKRGTWVIYGPLILLNMLNFLILQLHWLSLFSDLWVRCGFEHSIVVEDFERVVGPEGILLARQPTHIVVVSIRGSAADGRFSEEVIFIEIVRQLHRLAILILSLFLYFLALLLQFWLL